MTKKVYYIENTSALDNALARIEASFPCFIDREYIVMNYSQISINARTEDINSIQSILAPLV